jgi:hypothetical protein
VRGQIVIGGICTSALGVGSSAEDALEDGLVVEKDVAQRPRRLEVQAVGTLVARTEDIVVRMQPAFLFEALGELVPGSA